MKVLQVCSAPGFGGGERHVLDLTIELGRRGHELHLAVPPGSRLGAALAGAPVRIHELPLRGPLDLPAAMRLARIARDERIDVIHGHAARDWALCGMAAKLAPARLFLTRHHFRPMHGTALYAWAIGNATRILAVSQSVRERVVSAFPRLADRVVVVPNWIDAAACGSLPRDEARRRLEITRPLCAAIVGRLHPVKGHDRFLRAAAELVHGRGLRDIDFRIVGGAEPDDRPYEQSLRQQVAALDLAGAVTFTGNIDGLPPLLSAFDVVVAPSEDEAFSLAVAEAMAAGCAVIASRAGGLAELIDDGATGLLVPPDGALVEALARTLSDSALRARLGAAARASVIARFDRGRIVSEIVDLYRGTGPAAE